MNDLSQIGLKNKVFGNIGESSAVHFLKEKGYQILHTNYTNKIGEIDIVAKEKNYIVFVEVKNRSSNKFGRPCEAVTPAKQKKIRRVASLYLMKTKNTESFCRFDVIEVLDGEINHIVNAF